MRDDRKSKLVGDKSFGKGTVLRSLLILGAGSSVHITIAKWLTQMEHGARQRINT